MPQTQHTDETIKFLQAHLRKPIVLIGLMGAGKTSLGRKLAERLAIPFKDSDRIIEEKAGCSVNDIFQKFGEEKFRQSEHNTILQILDEGPCVLATGGGAIINSETRAAIKSKAVSIWLKLEVKDILKRLEHAQDRPLLKKGDPEKILTGLLAERKAYYEQADLHIESATHSPDETLNIIINSLYEHIKNDTV